MNSRRIIQVGNICALCGEKYPKRALQSCSICGLLYCGNCVISEDSGAVCLRCAVRRISPEPRRSKYTNLSILLAKKAKFKREVTLSFSEIENVIGSKLPESAYTRRSWWSNVRGRSPSEAWLTVGWIVKEVDLEGRRVTFIRGGEVQKKEYGEKRADGRAEKKAFKALALKAKMVAKSPRGISKTKIAMLQARLKNIERTRRQKKRYIKT